MDQELVRSAPATIAGAGQPTNTIVPLRPSGVTDEEDSQLRKEAQELAVAVSANPADVAVTLRVYQLGHELMKSNTERVSLMEARIGAVLREIETGNPTVKTLTQIKSQLDLVNPEVVGRTELTGPRRFFFGLITRTAKYLPKGDEVLAVINARKDTVATTIGGLQQHLWRGRDEALRNAIDLGRISDNLYSTQQQLLRAIYSGQLLWKELSEALAKEADPARAQALQTLVNDLAIQVVDLQTVDSVNTQSRMASEVLIGNCQKIGQAVARVTNVLLPAVSTNLAVKAAARQQLELIEQVSAISRAAEQTIVDTARETRTAVVRMNKMMSEGMINPAALEAACHEFVAMVDDIGRIQTEAEAKARETSRALATVAETMRRAADPLTNARQARLALESAKGEQR